MTEFQSDFETFLDSNGLKPEIRSSFEYGFPAFGISVILRPLDSNMVLVRSDDSVIFLSEDLWWRQGDIVKKRILAHLGIFRSCFARKCTVRQLETAESAPFFEAYHTYGNARSKYRFGLFMGDEMVAAASFSAGRPMPRTDRTVESFEWVRYASLPDVRVAGGMGRLLEAFVRTAHPEEVMSYADLEWSSGKVYQRLGFVESGFRKPVDFYIDTASWKRISVSKTLSDRKYHSLDTSSMPLISNFGSIKYLKRF